MGRGLPGLLSSKGERVPCSLSQPDCAKETCSAVNVSSPAGTQLNCRGCWGPWDSDLTALNYRPISLNMVLGKFMEQIILEEVTLHMCGIQGIRSRHHCLGRTVHFSGSTCRVPRYHSGSVALGCIHSSSVRVLSIRRRREWNCLKAAAKKSKH